VCNGAIAGDGRRNKEITSQLSSTTKVSVSLRMTARSTTFCNSRIFPGGPLAARASGIPLLVEYFVGHFAKESGKSVRHIGKQTLGQLQAYRANLKKHPPKRGVSALDDRENGNDRSSSGRDAWADSRTYRRCRETRDISPDARIEDQAAGHRQVRAEAIHPLMSGPSFDRITADKPFSH
jgi:hypothetical protein